MHNDGTCPCCTQHEEIAELEALVLRADMNIWPVRLTAAAWEEIKAAERKLEALEAAGVDNWEGYSEAMRSLQEDEGED